MNEASGTNTGCLARFKAEWALGIFSFEEIDGRKIDVDSTFQPKPRVVWICVKAFCFLWSISIIFAHLRKYDVVSFYLAYTSHWTFLLTIIYQILSLLAAILPSSLRAMSLLFRTLLVLGPTVAGMQLVNSFLYWTTDRQFQPEVGQTLYNNLALHGIFMVLVMLDMLLVNRSPVRPKHILGMYLYITLYMIWMLLHGVLNIGNPRTNGDNIYDNLSWTQKPLVTTLYFLLNYVVLIPLAFAVVYMISNGGCFGLCRNCRHYTSAEPTADRASPDEDEVQPDDGETGKKAIEMC